MKERICKNKKCANRYTPDRPLQGVCSAKCAYEYQRVLKENKDKKDWRDKKKHIVEGLKTHKDYLKILQILFNTYIRLRDKDLPCISCDCNMIGRKGDASHYYSVGSSPNLRFNEDNVHLACVPCNQFKHGNLIEYGIRLPFRIGFERFERLRESKGESNKMSIEEIKDKIIYYKNIIKTLK